MASGQVMFGGRSMPSGSGGRVEFGFGRGGPG